MTMIAMFSFDFSLYRKSLHVILTGLWLNEGKQHFNWFLYIIFVRHRALFVGHSKLIR